MSISLYLAETGQHALVQGTPETNVKEFKLSIEQVTGVAVGDQILLANSTKVENGKTLADYKIHGFSVVLYLFNRKMLLPSSVPPEVTIPDVQFKPRPLPQFISEDSKGNPLLSTFLNLEYNFLKQLHDVETSKLSIETKLDACSTLFTEQKVQASAISAALSNFQDHLENTIRAVKAFITSYQSLCKSHKDLLRNFSEEVDKLREIEIHPALQTNTVRTLVDCIPAKELVAWAAECQVEHEKLEHRVNDLRKYLSDLRSQAKRELDSHNRSDFKFDEQESTLQGVRGTALPFLQKLIDKCMDSFSQVKEQVTTIKASSTSGSLLWPKAQEFDEVFNAQKEEIGRVADFEVQVGTALEVFVDNKRKVTQRVHQKLKGIAELQSKTHTIASNTILYKEAAGRQQAAFSQLSFVKKLSVTYECCVDEIVRRRLYGGRLVSYLQKTSELVNQLTENEMQERKSFKEKYGKNVPHKIPAIKELLEARNLPLIKIRPPVFDANLPAISPSSSPAQSLSSSKGKLSALCEDHLSQLTAEKEKAELRKALEEAKAQADAYSTRIRELEGKLSVTYQQLSTEKSLSTSQPRVHLVVPAQSRSTYSSSALLDDAYQSDKSNASSTIDNEELKQANEELKTKLNRADEELATLKQQIEELKKEKKKKQDSPSTTKTSSKARLHSTTTDRGTAKGLATLCLSDLDSPSPNYSSLVSLLRDTVPGLPSPPSSPSSPSESLLVLETGINKLTSMYQEEKGGRKDCIALSGFEAGKLAMFFANPKGFYEAFNRNSPNYFLSEESLRNFDDQCSKNHCIYGVIIFIEEKHVEEDGNPYNLSSEHCTYYEVTIVSNE